MTCRAVAAALALALSLSVAGCASALSGPSITTTTPNGTSAQIPVELSKPDGSGPFPAVVIMHDCSGLGPRSSGAPGRWAKELVGRGYVVIMPDSFSTRGFPDGVWLAEAAQQAGYPVTIKIYPGAYHSFDSRNPVRYVAARINANAPSGRGATTGGDPAAWADSIQEVVAFFARNLR
jgi:dienelactone hydrolase